MTPLELGILIHYRGSAADYRFGDFSAPAVRQTIDWFRGEAGLLEPTNRDEYPNATYRLTAKGEFLVDQLCAMPLPVSVWVMPNVEHQGPTAGLSRAVPLDGPVGPLAKE